MDQSPLRIPRLACALWLAWSLAVVAVIAVAWARIPSLWIPFAAIAGIGACAFGWSKPLPALRLLVILFPLFGSVPAQAPTGWFPPVALLWHLCFAGWLAARVRRDDAAMPRAAIALALAGWCGLAVLSAAITAGRHARFWPLAGEPFFVFAVNALGETNVDAIRTVFATLALFLMGPAVAWMAACLHRTAADRAGTAIAAAAGLAASAAFGAWQSFGNEWVNNTPHFAQRGQINATFLDPNALGSWMMLALPMVAALAWRMPRARRALAALSAVALYVLLESGSRTGVLGLAIAGCIVAAFALARWVPRERRVPALAVAAAAVVAAAIGIGLLATVLGETALGQRVAATLSVAREKGIAGALLADRTHLWGYAWTAAREHLLSGIGYSAYWNDMPNFLGYGPAESVPFYRDNAANFYLQWLVEGGVGGLLLASGAIVLVVGRWACVAAGSDPDDRTLAVATAGVPAMAAMFVVGPHTNPAEVQFLFWLQAGMLFSNARSSLSRATFLRASTAGGALVLASAASLLHPATTSLSIRAMFARGEHFDVRGGFHPPEVGTDGRVARWTQRRAFVLVPNAGGAVETSIYVGHPDAQQHPVRLRAWADDVIVADWLVDAPASRRLEFAMPKGGAPVELRLEVDRAWVPAQTVEGSTDVRELGAMVADLRPVAAADVLP